MYYLFNNVIYKNGIPLTKSKGEGKCDSGDIISMILNFSKNEVTIKVNGKHVIESFSVEELSKLEEENYHLRICCDMTDPNDKVVFI